MNKESIYWMVLAHGLPAWSFSDKEGWKNEDKINLIIQFFHEKKESIEDFFQHSNEDWKNGYHLTDRQIADLLKAKSLLADYAFLAENLHNNGIEIIPVISSDYSKTLKENLKKSTPIILYLKGNKQIMNEQSIAIVGSRDASDVALKFTDNIAKLANKEYKVVVSGFAKGVDKQALDSAIACKGQSIIVLPQGITTFGSGLKTYYKQIIDGDILVLSTFHPNAGWGKELAMARNSIIYGLAKEIYVAESKSSKNKQRKETKGGTWAGVIDGLKKGRKVYVRKPDTSENNENNLLIQQGAVPVDFEGNIAVGEYKQIKTPVSTISKADENNYSFENRIRKILAGNELPVKDIIKKLDTELKPQKITAMLKKMDFVEIRKEKGKNIFKLNKREANLSIPF